MTIPKSRNKLSTSEVNSEFSLSYFKGHPITHYNNFFAPSIRSICIFATTRKNSSYVYAAIKVQLEKRAATADMSKKWKSIFFYFPHRSSNFSPILHERAYIHKQGVGYRYTHHVSELGVYYGGLRVLYARMVHTSEYDYIHELISYTIKQFVWSISVKLASQLGPNRW